ncbi:hypothetical protein ABFX02_11G032400 [Erythranthe guttata]
MSKRRNKAVVLDSAPPSYGGGGGGGMYEDSRARLKHQTLMQEYQELQKEVNGMKSKLEAGKQRKMMLAAEVRFLRRRYQHFVESRNMINSSEKEKNVQRPKSIKQTVNRKEVGHTRLSQVPEPKPKRKRVTSRGETSTKKTKPVLDTSLRNSVVAFDLNQDSYNSGCGKEASFPSRAPIFDLNEISTGDEDFQSNVEAVKKTRSTNEEVQNDLMLSICRNGGEVVPSSRVGKRKISWQDPVALRV